MFVSRRFSAQLSVCLWHQQHYRSVHPFRPIVDLDGRFPTVQRSNRRKPSASDMDKYSPPSAPIVRNPNERSLQVAVIGAPNAGKSELTNRLVGANVSAVSTKIDTTRSTTVGILTRNDMQLVVLDNPGLVSRAHAKSVMHIDPDCRFVTDPETAVSRSDLVIVVFDATSTGDYIHHRMLHMLHRHRHVPSILVVNKIDLVRRRSDLLELIRIITGGQVGGNAIKAVRNSVGKLGALCRGRNELKLHEKSRSTPAADNNRDARYQQMIETPTHQINWTSTRKLFETEPGWPHFDAVFYVSALTNEGVDSLRTFLIERGEQRQWHYDRSVVTTKSPQDICVDCLRGQLLDHLPHDVPYKLRIAVTTWEVDEGVLKIVIDVHCDVRRWAKMVIGNHGSTLVAIANNVNQEMRNLFKRELFIRILVKHNNEIIYREKTKKPIAIDTTDARSAPFQSS